MLQMTELTHRKLMAKPKDSYQEKRSLAWCSHARRKLEVVAVV